MRFVMWISFRRQTAVEDVDRLNAKVELVPGANPHRVYVVERGPLGLWWRVVKLT